MKTDRYTLLIQRASDASIRMANLASDELKHNLFE